MEKERKVVTVGKMSTELIVGFFAYGMIYGVIYCLLYNFLMYVLPMPIIIIKTTLLAVQGIFAFLTWRWNISSTFERRTITKNNVPAIMRALYIFAIILCIFCSMINFRGADVNLDQAVITQLKLSDIQLTDPDYQEQKDYMTKRLRNKLYEYSVIVGIERAVIYLGVVLLQKEIILENSIDEEI